MSNLYHDCEKLARPMYRISSTSKWDDGRTFNSLGEAKAYADRRALSGETCDVIALVDRDTYRVIYTPMTAPGGIAHYATYQKADAPDPGMH